MVDLIGVFALIVGLELVLGVDNILVITILVSRLEEKYQQKARVIGLVLAMVARIVLLFLLLDSFKIFCGLWRSLELQTQRQLLPSCVIAHSAPLHEMSTKGCSGKSVAITLLF